MPPYPDPAASLIVPEDIGRFWEAFDRAAFRDMYLRRASAGLKEWMRLRLGQTEDRATALLAEAAASHNRFYRSIRANTVAFVGSPVASEAIRESLHRFKAVYPEAVFPTVYLVIGVLSCRGTTTRQGILIGAEMFGCDAETSLHELSPWQRANVRRPAALAQTVVHELVHWHQPPCSRRATLLELALREGAAEFLSELISGAHEDEDRCRYGSAHESELWTEFNRAMVGTNATAWLYQGDGAHERPSDLAYFIGYRICEAHFHRSGDHRVAVRRLLTWTDPQLFLQESGYAPT